MKSRRVKQQQGFTVTQMLIVIAIIGVVSTFGVMGIRTARAEFRLYSSARLFASYVEKARADSVRRHAASGSEASVETFGAGTSDYAVTMDFGNGVETRTFQLDSGIDFETDALKVTFDWRGRLLVPCVGTKSCVYQVRSLFLGGKKVPVDVSGSGDITVDSQHFPDGLIKTVDIAEVTDGDVNPEPAPSMSPTIEEPPNPDGIDPVDSATPTPSPTATPPGNGNGNGGDNGNNGNGNSTPSPSPSASASASASPSPPIVQCSASISPNTVELSQGDSTKRTATATFTMVDASGVRTLSAAQDGNGNSLTIELSLSRIDGSGSSQVSVTAKNGSGNRGTFSVKVSASPSCGSTQTLKVIVGN